MAPEPVLYEVDAGVATITLNREEALHALDLTMVRLLAEASADAQRDREVRVVILTGTGDRAFCSGGDLASLIPRLTGGELEALLPDPTKRFFSDVFKPIVAAVNGLCYAGGLELLLGTDLRIASRSARFALTETRWGIIPGAGSHVRLPQQVPWAIAMELLLLGRPVSAERAWQVGLINEVVDPDQVRSRAAEVAATVAANAPLAVQAAKEIAVRALGNEPRFALEQAVNRRVLATEDAREGPRAFAEKRPPAYQGR